jgi:anti-anti-sigma factor
MFVFVEEAADVIVSADVQSGERRGIGELFGQRPGVCDPLAGMLRDRAGSLVGGSIGSAIAHCGSSSPRDTAAHARLPSGTLTVTVKGDLDIGTAPAFHRQISTLLEGGYGGRLELDFSLLDFCDVAGMRAIHAVAEAAAKTHHHTHITAAAPPLDTILQLCGIAVFMGYTAPQKTSKPFAG